jgi:glycosyltransferase involved in cell wall biosynthesis
MTAAPLRVGLVSDLFEEYWPSMDLVAERLEHHLRTDHAGAVAASCLRPRLQPRFSRVSGVTARGLGWTADRLLNRYLDYPRWLRRERVADRFDLFHVVDHSYAHLVHCLPAHRTVVTCHDLDAFQGVIAPLASPRSPLLRPMARYTLDGLVAAACVVCDSHAVRDTLLAHRIVPADRVRVVVNGVHPSRSVEPDAAADAAATELLGELSAGTPELLHVGSTIPRKRIDRLLHVFAGLVQVVPGARLVRVGGPLTSLQETLAAKLGITARICTLPFLEQATLSAVYRRAALLLLTSDAEGFGLPVVEALGSGIPVVATDLPVLREVGGEAISLCRADDLLSWVETISGLLREREQEPERWHRRRETGLRHAVRFSWRAYTDEIVQVYRSLIGDDVTRVSASGQAGGCGGAA